MSGLGTSEELRGALRTRYSQVAREPRGRYNFCVGRTFAEALGYPEDLLDKLPVSPPEAFTEVACPSLLAAVQPGQTVVDLGSGGGLDLVVLAPGLGWVHVIRRTQAQRADRRPGSSSLDRSGTPPVTLRAP